MSYADAYQPPRHVPNEPKPGATTLQYQEMFAYVFQNPNWVMNVLWGSLCLLVAYVIPIVPQMVLVGYQYDIIEAKHRRRTLSYPDFDTNRITDYLMRGLWPMLAALAVSIAFVIVAIPLMLVGLLISAALSQNVHEAFGVLSMIATFAIYFVAIIGLNVALVPLMLRAGLTQDFGQAFKMAWIKSFVSLVWKELLLGSIVLALGAFVLAFIGLLVLCVGLIPAMAIAMLAQAHLVWQLYEIFLERGGEPIPFKNAA